MTAIAILLALSLLTLGAVFWSVVVKVNTGAGISCQTFQHSFRPGYVTPGRLWICRRCGVFEVK